MKPTILVVGSGASGVHFTLSMLRKGYRVTMLDVGWAKPPIVNPEDNFDSLNENLPDPAEYFLGEEFEAVILPGGDDDYITQYYGFPSSKNYVFKPAKTFDYEADGMVPLVSFAQGGLAEAWTGGAYPLNDAELGEFPFGYEDIRPYYEEVTRRIGINGAADDLARFIPVSEALLLPLDLDENSEDMLARYQIRKTIINKKYGCSMGRSRVTTLSQDQDGREGCTCCGRCLWGCPNGALYTPSLTLETCRQFANFTYIPGMFVHYFDVDARKHIKNVIAESLQDGRLHTFTADTYVLASGTLSSSKIFLDTFQRATGEIVKLTGLMDNRQVLVPFVNLNHIGKAYHSDRYQYHQLALGLEAANPFEYIHGQITTLKTLQIHPVLQNMPLGLRSAIEVFKIFRTGMGVVNLSFYDHRRSENYITLSPLPESWRTKLAINYLPEPSQHQMILNAVKRLRGALRELGSIVIPGTVLIRPIGASVHYTGTLPMSEKSGPLSTSKYCQSYDFENLYLVDGSTIPFLPAKNITLTLMANALRIAEEAF